jgi:hypothetical protein
MPKIVAVDLSKRNLDSQSTTLIVRNVIRN